MSAAFGPGAAALLALMARVAGWRPDEFWAATPADVAMVLNGWADADDAAGVERCALAAMMEQFPDGG